MNRLEKLINALEILEEKAGIHYPACELSNCESTGYQKVLNALMTVYNTEDFTEHKTSDEWFYMDEEEQKTFEDYTEFCYFCNTCNACVIRKAIKTGENEVEQLKKETAKTVSAAFFKYLEVNFPNTYIVLEDVKLSLRYEEVQRLIYAEIKYYLEIQYDERNFEINLSDEHTMERIFSFIENDIEIHVK